MRLGTLPTPAPEGPYAVGSVSTKVAAVELTAYPSPQAMPIRFWYPARPDARLMRGRRWRVGWWQPRPAADASEGIAPGDAPQRFPLLLYLPAWGGRRDDNTFLAASLASRGYVVAAIDDLSADPGLWQAPGTQSEDVFDLSSDAATEAAIAAAGRHVARMAGAASRLLDLMQGDDFGPLDLPLRGRLDMARIGIFGFSIGGSSAATALNTDPRFLAAANLDGWLFGEAVAAGLAKPYLVVNSDNPALGPRGLHSRNPVTRRMTRIALDDLAWQRRQLANADSHAVFIDRAAHTDLSDALFALTPRRLLRLGPGRAARVHASLRTLLAAFFDAYVGGRNEDAPLSELHRPRSGVRSLRDVSV